MFYSVAVTGAFNRMPEPVDRQEKHTPTLRVYVADHCPICRDAVPIVEMVRRKFSRVEVRVINLEAEQSRNVDGVFSVPTYILDGRTLSLGNPDTDVLVRQLSQALIQKERQ